MKIPTWAAGAFLAGALTFAGIAFQSWRGEIVKMRDDITTLKVSVAGIEARMDPAPAPIASAKIIPTR